MTHLTLKSIRNLFYFIILLFLTLSLSGQIRPLAAGTSALDEVGFVDSGQTLGTGMSQDVALGDVDGDLDLDAIVVNYDSGSTVWLNDGVGTFTDSGQSLGLGAALDIALGDIDGDTDLDAFVVRDAFGDSNEVWINQGAAQAGEPGIFVPNGQTFGHDLSSGVDLGDLDGDGDLDAYVARSNGRPDKIWLNDGSGQFNDSGQSLGSSSAVNVALGDVDGDGDTDAFAAGGGANKVWLNNGSGQFSDSGQNLGSDLTIAVGLSDLDGDGDLDAFTANNGDDRVWLNQGGVQSGAVGVFADSGQALASASSRDVALADVDGDGDIDAFVARFGGNFVYVNQGGGQNGTGGDFIDSGLNLGDANTEGVALGDVDGDGDLDAIVANFDIPDRVWMNSIIHNSGGTGYFTRTKASFGKINTASDFELGDLDGDGDLDGVGVIPDEGSSRSWIFINDGEGNFANSGQTLGNSNDVVLGDLDGDGDLDALADDVWLNNGEGQFSKGQQLGEFSNAALADLDGDDDLDVFTYLNSSRKYFVLLNTGVGQFDSGQLITSFFDYPSDIALGDLDGDGDIDVFIANGGNNNEVGNRILLNNGSGVFYDSGQRLGHSFSMAVDLGDVDDDGDLDAFVANLGPGRLWINDGNGVFSEGEHTFGDRFSRDAALDDLDGDGDLDIFVANYFPRQTDTGDEVWLNAGNQGFFKEAQCLENNASFFVSMGDVDGDGDPDAVVGGEAGIWLNGLFPDHISCLCALEWLVNQDSESAQEVLQWPSLDGVQRSLVNLTLFYRVRDEILTSNSFGLHFSKLYYDHNREILDLLMANDALRNEGSAVLEMWSPNLQALVDGRGETAVINSNQVQAVDQFLTNLSNAAGPDLQQAISTERARLPNLDTFAGLTMAEAKKVIIGQTIYLSIIQAD